MVKPRGWNPKIVPSQKSHFSLFKGPEPSTIYHKPMTNIIPNSEHLKDFLLNSAARKECPLSPLLFNIMLEIIGTAVRQERKKEGRKERKKGGRKEGKKEKASRL